MVRICTQGQYILTNGKPLSPVMLSANLFHSMGTLKQMKKGEQIYTVPPKKVSITKSTGQPKFGS